MFAPGRLERFLSYLTGWLTSIGWTSGIVSISSLLAVITEGMIELHYPDYTPENWHTTLLIIAFVVLAISFNIGLATWLPFFEAVMALISIGGIFAVCSVLLLLLPTNNPHDAFLQFTNNTDWTSDGAAFMTTLLFLILSLLGFDCPAHMCMY
jgi:choline transport protein